MECRTPLIEYIPSNKGGQNQCYTNQPSAAGSGNGGGSSSGWSTRNLGGPNHSRGSNSRGGNGGTMNNKPAAPPIKRRLPLPKNVVLMSLIEATELATANVQGQEHEPSLHDSPMINPSVLDMEDDEEEKIKTGTSLAISDCGTYAVAAKGGLEIFPNRPESLLQHSEEDVDTLVRFYNKDSNIGGLQVPVEGDDKITSEDEPPRKESSSSSSPGRLSWGDRVQIVSTQNGWAKMARGYGYVRAGAQQLVKGTYTIYHLLSSTITIV